MLLFPTLAFADALPDPSQVVPATDALFQIIALLGGVKGASGLGLALVVGKVLMAFLQSDLMASVFEKNLKDAHGKWRFLTVSIMTLLLAVLAQMAAGQSLAAALMNGSVATMASVYFNQFYKQFVQKDA